MSWTSKLSTCLSLLVFSLLFLPLTSSKTYAYSGAVPKCTQSLDPSWFTNLKAHYVSKGWSFNWNSPETSMIMFQMTGGSQIADNYKIYVMNETSRIELRHTPSNDLEMTPWVHNRNTGSSIFRHINWIRPNGTINTGGTDDRFSINANSYVQGEKPACVLYMRNPVKAIGYEQSSDGYYLPAHTGDQWVSGTLDSQPPPPAGGGDGLTDEQLRASPVETNCAGCITETQVKTTLALFFALSLVTLIGYLTIRQFRWRGIG